MQDFVLWRELTNLTISPEILIEFLHCILRKQLPILIIVFTSCKNEVVRFWYIKFLIFLWNSEYCELKKIFMERPILFSNKKATKLRGKFSVRNFLFVSPNHCYLGTFGKIVCKTWVDLRIGDTKFCERRCCQKWNKGQRLSLLYLFLSLFP